MTKTYNILSLGGDHIGPEVVESGLNILRVAANNAKIKIEVDEDLLGGASWDVHGSFCTDAVLRKAQSADAILVGAVGGPKWDSMVIDGPVTETDGLTKLRVELDVYNALRPARAWKPLLSKTPYRKELVENADLLVIRENSGGIYYGEPRGTETLEDGQIRAFEISHYRTFEVERIARCAFEAARSRFGQVTSLDKSNVMESGKLWRETISRIGRHEYPDVKLNHLLMDYALYAVGSRPKEFDVIVADNLFGDLISDLVGMVAGSLGMLPSATLPCAAEKGKEITGGIYEASHGSAPDISGKGIANPMATILSVGMMFEYAFAREDIARKIESAVNTTLEQGIMTPDLGGSSTTKEVTDTVLKALLD